MAATITTLRHTEGQSLAAAARGQLPICESQLGKLWRAFKDDPPYTEHIYDGFCCRYELWGAAARELREWDDAGCPHVCGR